MDSKNYEGFSAVARDHATNPRNYGPLQKFDGHSRIMGSCGDTMEFWLHVSEGKVENVSFVSDGCGPSLACGSMTTILAKGKQIGDATAPGQQEILNALGGLPPDAEHCALLAINTLKAAVQDFLKQQADHRPIIVLNGAYNPKSATKEITPEEDKHMKIAIPLAGDKLTAHFGHCERFALVEVDMIKKSILKREDIVSPPHQPGLLPPWLAERGATLVIAGGMGQRARDIFIQHGVDVVVGAPVETPEKLVADYLAGTLQVGDNACDH